MEFTMAKALQQAIINWTQFAEKRYYPKCFDSREQYESWLEFERDQAKTLPIRRFACRDCTPEYQRKMTIEKRCVNSDIDVLMIAD